MGTRPSTKNRWATFGVHLYYLIGFFYYVYQWFIIGGGAGIVVSLVGGYFGGSHFWWGIAGLVSLAALIVGLSISFVNWRRRYQSVNSGLKILLSHTTYTILPNNHYKYRRVLDLVVSVHSVDHFTHFFGWTGRGPITASVDNGHTAEITDDDKSIKKRLCIYFDRPRAKGDKFKIAFEIELQDVDGTARNFLRTMMHEKVRTLIAEIAFSDQNCPESIKRAIYMSDVAEIPVYEEDILVSRGQTSISWTVKKPRLNYNYCISW
jgi:hypothetical protein